MKRYISLSILYSLLITLHISCSYRLIRYNKDVDKLQNKEITKDEFYKRYYTLKKRNFSSENTNVKCEGSYVYRDLDGNYEFISFLKGGYVVESLKMYDYPNSITMMNNIFWQSCYYVDGNNIELEYVNSSNGTLSNHIKSGYILGDTIFFTEIRTVQAPLLKPSQIKEKYIYDSELKYIP